MKYTEEEKQKFRDLVAQGKPLREAAAEAGISLAIGMKIRGADNKKKKEESSPAPGEDPEEEEEENLSEGSVPPPGSGGGGAEDGSGARGAEGARDALSGDKKPEEEKTEGDPGEEKGEGEKQEGQQKEGEKEKPKIDPAEVLVNLSEMLSAGMVWIFARRKKVKLTAKQREELAWSAEERSELLRYARQAAAALPAILIALGPYVGLLFYGYLLYSVTRSRCERVSEFGPERADDAGEEEEIKDATWEEKKPDQLNDKTEDW